MRTSGRKNARLRDRWLTLPLLLVASAAWAGPTGGDMPWSEPLDRLRENLTGPTLTAVVLIAIALGLAAWSVGDSNRGLVKAGKALVALAAGAGGIALLAALGITASAL